MNKNKLARYLDKPRKDFTKADIITFIDDHDIRMLNFRYVGGDGKLKTLNFVINSKEHLHQLLSTGERVDGSSLFSHIDPESSDLYVIPRFRTAFMNPFSEQPTVDLLCSYYTAEGEPLPGAPEQLVRKACDVLTQETGYTLQALGELEFYLFSELDPIYKITPKKGYQESHPFSKLEFIRLEAMNVISEIGGKIKYGHAEVGNIIHDDREMVQHEIEFLPVDAPDAADQLVLAKWVIREIAYKYGLIASFAPKIMVGQAGSGLHFHMRLMKDGNSAMVENGHLSPTAKRFIAGLLEMAPSLSAFGNTVPTSYLRLVPHQEAPTSICWGERNRATLVRVPLGWLGVKDMVHNANPLEKESTITNSGKQTVELRSPDGSAYIHHLIAGLAIAARRGLANPEARKNAESAYLGPGKKIDLSFPILPTSCFEAAEALEKARDIYEDFGVFTSREIDGAVKDLKSFNDENLSERLFEDGNKLKDLVDKYLHCG